MKKANDIYAEIKTCLSFYNEKASDNHDISAKNIYDEILITKNHKFYTTDQNILYPLSSFIKQIDDISDCDIVIACDNTTAQIALSLGKYCILITDQRYKAHCHKKQKKYIIINIKDKNLYGKIGKAYRNFTKQIENNIYNENYTYYLKHKNDDSEQFYFNSIMASNDKKYHVAIWSLNDIPQSLQDINILRFLLKLYHHIKDYQQFLKTAELLKQKTDLSHNEYLNYLYILFKIKQRNKINKEIDNLYKKDFFIYENISPSNLFDFYYLLYKLGRDGCLKKILDNSKLCLIVPHEIRLQMLLLYFRLTQEYKKQSYYFKLSLQNMYCTPPVWQGETIKKLIIFFLTHIGDSIAHISLLQYIIPYTKEITLSCDKRLHNLFKRSFPTIDLIYSDKSKLGIKNALNTNDYEYQISAFDLPCVLSFDPLQHKPQKLLVADDNLKNQYRQKLKKQAQGKIIIGISNAKKHTLRYIDWQYWQPILNLYNVIFVNLEYDATSKKYFEKYAQKNDYNLITWQEPHPIIEFDEFTALVSACDIIISGQTTLTHQAGGLGIPSFILITNNPSYLYRSDTDKSVWYENQYYIRARDYQAKNKRPNYKKMMTDASEKIKNYIDKNFS